MFPFFKIDGVPVAFRQLRVVNQDGPEILATARKAGVERVLCVGQGTLLSLIPVASALRANGIAFKAVDLFPFALVTPQGQEKLAYLRSCLGDDWRLLEESEHQTLCRLLDAGELRDGRTLLCIPAHPEGILTACHAVGLGDPDIAADAQAFRFSFFEDVRFPQDVSARRKPLRDHWLGMLGLHDTLATMGRQPHEVMAESEQLMMGYIPQLLRDCGFVPRVSAFAAGMELFEAWKRLMSPVDIFG